MSIRDVDPSTESWSTIRSGSGNTSNDSLSSNVVAGYSVGTGGTNYRTLYRGIYIFDTDAIPDTDHVSSTTVSFYGSAKIDSNSATPDVNIYGQNKTDSDTSVVAAHYENAASTAFSDSVISYANWSTSTYNNFILNAAGVANINVTGKTRFTIRNANYDVANVTPSTSGGSQAFSYLSSITAETDGSGHAQDPKLVVLHVALPSLRVRKAANQSVSNSTSLESVDNDLNLGLASNTTYIIDSTVLVEASSTAPDLKIRFVAPYGSEVDLGYAVVSGASQGVLANYETGSTIPLEANVPTVIRISGTVKVAATAGAFQFRWGQATADSALLTVRRGSYLRAEAL